MPWYKKLSDNMLSSSLSTTPPSSSQYREVICADALVWLREKEEKSELFSGSVFTSLPDISEIPHLFPGFSTKLQRHDAYEKWFIKTAALIIKLLKQGEYAIFLQSDVRVQDFEGHTLKWLDKSYLCSVVAAQSGCQLLWHKIAYTCDLSLRSSGRPNYSHLLCHAKDVTPCDTDTFFIPDIFHRGEMVWPKAVGLNCCIAGVAFLKSVAKTPIIIDPFCGYGTILAVSNALGISSLGVEISKKRCRLARNLSLGSQIASIGPRQLSLLGIPKSEQYVLAKYKCHTQTATSDCSKNTEAVSSIYIIYGAFCNFLPSIVALILSILLCNFVFVSLW